MKAAKVRIIQIDKRNGRENRENARWVSNGRWTNRKKSWKQGRQYWTG